MSGRRPRAVLALLTAASLLGQYGSLDALLAAGRFGAEADALRAYRHIATFDRSAPLPTGGYLGQADVTAPPMQLAM